MIIEETELDTPDPKGIATLWKNLIVKEEKAHKQFRELADDAQEAYEKSCSYNIMWPTVEITTASLYSSTPNPEVNRRQKDGDKAQKSAAQVIERAIDYCLDSHDYDGNMEQSISDFAVAGLGTTRVIYKPEFTTQISPMTGMEEEVIASQTLEMQHVSWKHFGWQPSKSWEDCDWVYFIHYMDKKKVREEYGVEAAEDERDDDDTAKVKIYEIFHKPSESVVVICDQFDVPLDVRKDELGLSGFFPCPEPMMTNVLTDKLIPLSDFMYYSTQYKQLDNVSKRIGALVRATKAISYYDSSFQELAKLKTSIDGAFIPVDNMVDKLSGSTMDNVLANMPLDHNTHTIQLLVENKEYLKNEVFEILGIADIMRGETNAQEGVETQQLKSEFGAIRIRTKQNVVNRFNCDVFRIMGEIIAEHFEPQVLQKLTGVEITEDVMAILRSDVLRNFSIDIETDSTNALDQLQRKKDSAEAIQSVIGAFSSILPGMQSGVIPQALGQELMLLVLRSQETSVGNLEDVIAGMGEQGSPEAMVQQLQRQLMQAQQQIQAMQAELEKTDQADTAKNMSIAQLNQAKTQETLSKIPNNQVDVAHTQSEIELNQVEAAGKRVEQAGNIAANMQGRPVNLVGIE